MESTNWLRAYIFWRVPDLALYFPGASTAPLWGFNVTACGRATARPGAVYPPNPEMHPDDHLFVLPKGGRIINAYQLIFLEAGEGSFESLATGILPLQAGSAFFVFPGVWHRYAPTPSKGWRELYVEFEGPGLAPLRASRVLDPARSVFEGRDTPGFVENFYELFRLAEEGGPGARERMAALAIHLLASVLHARTERKLPRADALVRDAERHLRDGVGRRIDMVKLARELDLPYDQFRRHFKARTGLAPKQYHRKLQMRRAEEWLLQTNRTLEQIATDLGFDSAFHLSAAFKKHTGLSPTAWRKTRLHQH